MAKIEKINKGQLNDEEMQGIFGDKVMEGKVSEEKGLIALKDLAITVLDGNLPQEVTKEQLQKMLTGDLQKTIEGVTPRLPQIKIMHAGALVFEIPSDTIGKNKKVEEFTGIIIDQHPCNAYWEKSFGESGGGVIPTCPSLDGKEGLWEGQTKRKCAGCEFNQFGSAGEGQKGKACKNMKRLHILTEDSELPYRLTLPPSSIKEADTFFSALLGKGIPMTTLKVKFKLADAASGGGIHYSQIRFEPLGQIKVEQYLQIKKFLADHLAQIRGQEIVSEEYINGESEGTDFDPKKYE